MSFRKRILVAPLNWGLGHATRCIPIIRELENHKFQPVLASDGMALNLLRKEFPDLETLELPSYDISYSKKGQFFKIKMLQSTPKLVKAVKAERNAIQRILNTHNIDGIISDNRFGVYSKNVPSVFITHQLQVLSGNTTWLSTKMHQRIIQKFDECWVPDSIGEDNLSGRLGHTDLSGSIVKYIGPLSRFKKNDIPKRYDLLVLLSGPEPQRSQLETILLKELKRYKGKVLFVRGLVEAEVKRAEEDHLELHNYMTSSDLEKAINESNYVLSRSGYTSIMDLEKLQKKGFFIPTPGQFEQEYLAERFTALGLVPSCKQEDFSVEKLENLANFKGLSFIDYSTNYRKLFSLFQGE